MIKSERVSESLRLGTILMLTGGFLDAYSYLIRGNVFATAETGNIVLLGINLASGNFGKAGRYLIPIVSYAVGIFVAEWIKKCIGDGTKVHWKEGVLWLELLIVFAAGFIPQAGNSVVNCMIAFVCAMQVEAFRRMHGNAYATTMCTGNLRSGTELLSVGLFQKEPEKIRSGLSYYWIDFVFVIGAVISTFVCRIFAESHMVLRGHTACGTGIYTVSKKKRGGVTPRAFHSLRFLPCKQVEAGIPVIRFFCQKLRGAPGKRRIHADVSLAPRCLIFSFLIRRIQDAHAVLISGEQKDIMTSVGKYACVAFAVAAHVGDNTSSIFQMLHCFVHAVRLRIIQIKHLRNHRTENLHISTGMMVGIVLLGDGDQALQGDRFCGELIHNHGERAETTAGFFNGKTVKSAVRFSGIRRVGNVRIIQLVEIFHM